VRTVFTYGLIAAGQAERINGKFVADSASQLEWNFILSEGADGTESALAPIDLDYHNMHIPCDVHQARRLVRHSH
jgi:hypothetical protein